jgi:hypothetical protein
MPEGDRAVKCDLHCESDAECIDQPATININLGLRKIQGVRPVRNVSRRIIGPLGLTEAANLNVYSCAFFLDRRLRADRMVLDGPDGVICNPKTSISGERSRRKAF